MSRNYMMYGGFARQVAEDDERDERIAERRIVQERCWHCSGVGRVYVPDGTAFPALVNCAICAGSGQITTERQG
jgi:hypothetical protein